MQTTGIARARLSLLLATALFLSLPQPARSALPPEITMEQLDGAIVCGNDINQDGEVSMEEMSLCTPQELNGFCDIQAEQCTEQDQAPECPAGSTFDPDRDVCWYDPQTHSCPNGYTYLVSIDRCVAAPECPEDGTFNPTTDRCEKYLSDVCPENYTYEPNTQICYRDVNCSGPFGNGSYNIDLDRCEMPHQWDCPIGFMYVDATALCEASPGCPAGSVYNPATNLCERAVLVICPDGYEYDAGTDLCTVEAKCLLPSLMNFANDRCEVTTTILCPANTVYNPNPTYRTCESNISCPDVVYASNDWGSYWYDYYNICYTNYANIQCPNSYSFTWTGPLCYKSIDCIYGGFDPVTDSCFVPVDPVASCQSPYIWNSIWQLCYSGIDCSHGVAGTFYYMSYKKCVIYAGGCPSGYSWNATYGTCTATPSCQFYATWNPTLEMCVKTANQGCLDGFSVRTNIYYAPTGGQMCYAYSHSPPASQDCSPGAYDTGYDLCYYNNSFSCPVPGMSYYSSTELRKCSMFPSCTIEGTTTYIGTYSRDTSRCEYAITGTVGGACPSGYSLRPGTTTECQDSISPYYTCQNITRTIFGQTRTLNGYWNSSWASCYHDSSGFGIMWVGSGLDAWVGTPTCPSGSWWYSSYGACYYSGTMRCPTGYTLRPNTTTCAKPPTCPTGGVYANTQNLCLAQDSGVFCPVGYTYSATYSLCVAAPQCPGGTFSSATDKCEKPAVFACPDPGYVPDPMAFRCNAQPMCADGIYDEGFGKCILPFPGAPGECPPYYTFQAGDGMCHKSVACPPGTIPEDTYCVVDASYVCTAPYTIQPVTNECLALPTCLGGGSYSSQYNVCIRPYTNQCVDPYTYNDIAQWCQKPPSCPGLGTYDGTDPLNNCRTDANIQCPATYTYSQTLKACWRDSTCPNGGTLDPVTDQCLTTGTPGCPAAYTWDGTAGACFDDPVCDDPAGTFVAIRDRCERDMTVQCQDPYQPDYTRNRCEILPVPPCEPDMSYSVDLNKCTRNYYRDCPADYPLNVGHDQCEKDPDCPPGMFYDGTPGVDLCAKQFDLLCPSAAGYVLEADQLCRVTPPCGPGNYNTGLDRCTLTRTASCATTAPGYTYDGTDDRCEREAYVYCDGAPASYNTSKNKCVRSLTNPCPGTGGWTHQPSRNRCERIPDCTDGYTYNAGTNQCEQAVSGTCNEVLTDILLTGGTTDPYNFCKGVYASGNSICCDDWFYDTCPSQTWDPEFGWICDPPVWVNQPDPPCVVFNGAGSFTGSLGAYFASIVASGDNTIRSYGNAGGSIGTITLPSNVRCTGGYHIDNTSVDCDIGVTIVGGNINFITSDHCDDRNDSRDFTIDCNTVSYACSIAGGSCTQAGVPCPVTLTAAANCAAVGGTLDLATDACHIPITPPCNDGYTSDGSECIKDVPCPSGSLDIAQDRCANVASYYCSDPAFTYDNGLLACTKDVSCPNGGALDPTAGIDKCVLTPSHGCVDPTMNYDSSSDRCLKAAVCLGGAPGTPQYDPNLDVCWLPWTPACTNGTYDPVSQLCLKNPVCPSGGVVDPVRDQCYLQLTSCPGTYQWDATDNRCEQTPPPCPPGTAYNAAMDMCTRSSFPDCSTGWDYDATHDQCEKDPDCPSGSQYNVAAHACLKNAVPDCPNGMSYNGTTGRCEGQPDCATAGFTYDGTTGMCEGTVAQNCTPSTVNVTFTGNVPDRWNRGISSANCVNFYWDNSFVGNLCANSGVTFTGDMQCYAFDTSSPYAAYGCVGLVGNGSVITPFRCTQIACLAWTEVCENAVCSEVCTGGYYCSTSSANTTIAINGVSLTGGDNNVDSPPSPTRLWLTASANQIQLTNTGTWHGAAITAATLTTMNCPTAGGTPCTGSPSTCTVPATEAPRCAPATWDSGNKVCFASATPDCGGWAYDPGLSQCKDPPPCVGGAFNAGQDTCWKAWTPACAGTFQYNAGSGLCVLSPVCEYAGTFVGGAADLCWLAMDYGCGQNASYDPVLQVCYSNMTCSDGGSFDYVDNRCELSATVDCGAGNTYVGTGPDDLTCAGLVACPDDPAYALRDTIAYSPGTDKCVAAPVLACAIQGYQFNNDTLDCRTDANCEGSMHDTVLDICHAPPEPQCLSGGTFDPQMVGCVITPTCFGGGHLDPDLDRCVVDSIPSCTWGDYRPDEQRCVYLPGCPVGSIDPGSGDCIAPLGNGCPLSMTHEVESQVCVGTPQCVNGALDYELGTCYQSMTPPCPTGYSLNIAAALCSMDPVCPPGGSFSGAINLCNHETTHYCPEGYEWNPTLSMCSALPLCPDATLNPASDYCETPQTYFCDGATGFTPGLKFSPPGFPPGWFAAIPSYCWQLSSCPAPATLQNNIPNFGSNYYCYDTTTPLCAAPYYWDTFINYCLSEPLCDGPGTFERPLNRCMVRLTNTCAAGYTLDTDGVTCYDSTVCPDGTTLDASHECTSPANPSCPDATWTFHVTRWRCEKLYQCPAGTIHDPNRNWCYDLTPEQCPVGYTFDAPSNQCRGPFYCQSSPPATYNATWKLCNGGAPPCPDARYTFNPSSNYCELPPQCRTPAAGVTVTPYMDHNKSSGICYYRPGGTCPTGWALQPDGITCRLSSIDTLCASPGWTVVFDNVDSRCEASPLMQCPSAQFTANWSRGWCEKAPDCPAGTTYSPTRKICVSTPTANCPDPTFFVDIANSLCYKTPDCPAPGGYDPALNLCAIFSDRACGEVGFNVDYDREVCWLLPDCTGGTLNPVTELCEAEPSIDCGGWTYDETTGWCYLEPICAPGSYAVGPGRCEIMQSVNCGTYNWIPQLQLCELAPQCPRDPGHELDASIAYSNILNLCISGSGTSCMFGFDWIAPPISLCEMPVDCPGDYEYDPVFNVCKGNGLCPWGTQYECMINPNDPSTEMRCARGALQADGTCQGWEIQISGEVLLPGVYDIRVFEPGGTEADRIVTTFYTPPNMIYGDGSYLSVKHLGGASGLAVMWRMWQAQRYEASPYESSPGILWKTWDGQNQIGLTVFNFDDVTGNLEILGQAQNDSIYVAGAANTLVFFDPSNPPPAGSPVGTISFTSSWFTEQPAQLGLLYCSPNPCVAFSDAENVTEENADLSSLIDDGREKDGSGNDTGDCLGEWYIFNGKPEECLPPGTKTMFFDCCDDSSASFWFIQEACPPSSVRAVMSMQAETDHYVGTYCKKKIKFIGCVQRAKVYCSFGTKLGRIVHEQGREQLTAFQPDGNWGDAKNPNCRGFTPTEFEALDFGQIDMSEYIGDIVPASADTVQQNISNSINNFTQSLSP